MDIPRFKFQQCFPFKEFGIAPLPDESLSPEALMQIRKIIGVLITETKHLPATHDNFAVFENLLNDMLSDFVAKGVLYKDATEYWQWEGDS